jgi:hypothetical protein
MRQRTGMGHGSASAHGVQDGMGVAQVLAVGQVERLDVPARIRQGRSRRTTDASRRPSQQYSEHLVSLTRYTMSWEC